MRPVPNVLRATVTVDKATLKLDGRHIDRILRQLREQLCAEIARVRFSTQEDTYSTTFRAEAIVLSPDDFWRIVQEEALRLNSYFSPGGVSE